MPQRKAAKSELPKNKKRHAQNIAVKNVLKSAIKKFRKSIDTAEMKILQENLKNAYKILDKAASKKIIHHRKAARIKSRLCSIANKKSSKKTKS